MVSHDEGAGRTAVRRQKAVRGRPPNVNENSLLRRLECVLAVERNELSMIDACRKYDISARTFYRWLRNRERLIQLTGVSPADLKSDQAQLPNHHEEAPSSLTAGGKSQRSRGLLTDSVHGLPVKVEVGITNDESLSERLRVAMEKRAAKAREIIIITDSLLESWNRESAYGGSQVQRLGLSSAKPREATVVNEQGSVKFGDRNGVRGRLSAEEGAGKVQKSVNIEKTVEACEINNSDAAVNGQHAMDLENVSTAGPNGFGAALHGQNGVSEGRPGKRNSEIRQATGRNGANPENQHLSSGRLTNGPPPQKLQRVFGEAESADKLEVSFGTSSHPLNDGLPSTTLDGLCLEREFPNAGAQEQLINNSLEGKLNSHTHNLKATGMGSASHQGEQPRNTRPHEPQTATQMEMGHTVQYRAVARMGRTRRVLNWYPGVLLDDIMKWLCKVCTLPRGSEICLYDGVGNEVVPSWDIVGEYILDSSTGRYLLEVSREDISF